MQGGPPTRRSGRSFALSPAAPTMSGVGTSRMSCRITGLRSPSKFFSMVSAASSLISTAAATWKPASSTPRSRPPQPEKSEIAMLWCEVTAPSPANHIGRTLWSWPELKLPASYESGCPRGDARQPKDRHPPRAASSLLAACARLPISEESSDRGTWRSRQAGRGVHTPAGGRLHRRLLLAPLPGAWHLAEGEQPLLGTEAGPERSPRSTGGPGARRRGLGGGPPVGTRRP